MKATTQGKGKSASNSPTKKPQAPKAPRSGKPGKTPGTSKRKPAQLNIRQQRFAEFVVAGESDVQAYIKAGYTKSIKNAEANAWRVKDNDGVKALIAKLRQPQTKAALRKKEDNLRFLAEVIGTALDDIGPDSPLCTECTTDFIAGGSRGKLKRGQADHGNEVAGPDIIRRRVKKPDPLRAIELYSKLLGHFEPDRVEVEAGPKTLLSIKERAAEVSSALARRYSTESG